MRWLALVLVVAGALLSARVLAQAPCNTSGLFDRVANKYGVDPTLLYAIALVESNARPGLVSKPNANGSVDHGAMQINSIHFGTLREYGILPHDLYDPCINVDVGGWVLQRCFHRFGVSWDGVGCYNSVTPHLRRAYALKVYRKLAQLRQPVTREARALAARRAQLNHSQPLICAHRDGCIVEISRGHRFRPQSSAASAPLEPQR